jgi:hypothetical protein
MIQKVTIQAASATYEATVQVNAETLGDKKMPDELGGSFVNYGNDPMIRLALQPKDGKIGATMWFSNRRDGYRFTKYDKDSGEFSILHMRVNPNTSRRGFER